MIIRQTNHFIKWFEKLPGYLRLIIAKNIDKLANNNFSNCKSIGDGIHEQKIDFQKGYRIYFINKNGMIIILLLGGDKSSQQKDIEKAKRMKKELEAQNENR